MYNKGILSVGSLIFLEITLWCLRIEMVSQLCKSFTSWTINFSSVALREWGKTTVWITDAVAALFKEDVGFKCDFVLLRSWLCFKLLYFRTLCSEKLIGFFDEEMAMEGKIACMIALPNTTGFPFNTHPEESIFWVCCRLEKDHIEDKSGSIGRSLDSLEEIFKDFSLRIA